jgi:hypothetical protein
VALDEKKFLIVTRGLELHSVVFDLFALACNRQQVNGFNVDGCHGSVPFLYGSSEFDCSLEFFGQAFHRHHEGHAMSLHHHGVVSGGHVVPPFCLAAESAQASAVADLLPVMQALSLPIQNLCRL